MYYAVEGDHSKIARQTEEDCSAFYFSEDEGTRYPRILPAGHDGLHMDPTGIEFS